MLFADDLELCEEKIKEAEQLLEMWRNAMESRGLRLRAENKIFGTFGIREQTSIGQPGATNCFQIQHPGLELRVERRC